MRGGKNKPDGTHEKPIRARMSSNSEGIWKVENIPRGAQLWHNVAVGGLWKNNVGKKLNKYRESEDLVRHSKSMATEGMTFARQETEHKKHRARQAAKASAGGSKDALLKSGMKRPDVFVLFLV